MNTRRTSWWMDGVRELGNTMDPWTVALTGLLLAGAIAIAGLFALAGFAIDPTPGPYDQGLILGFLASAFTLYIWGAIIGWKALEGRD